MEARRWRWAGLASVGRAPARRGREGVSSATTACRGGRRAPRPPPFLGRRRPGPPPTVSLPGGVRLLRLARSPGAAAGSSTRRPLGGGGGGSSPCPSGAPLPSAARLSPSGAGRSPVAASPRTGVPSARLGTRATRRRCPPRCRRRPPPPAGGGSVGSRGGARRPARASRRPPWTVLRSGGRPRHLRPPARRLSLSHPGPPPASGASGPGSGSPLLRRRPRRPPPLALPAHAPLPAAGPPPALRGEAGPGSRLWGGPGVGRPGVFS